MNATITPLKTMPVSISIDRKVVGWQHIDLTREGMEDVVRQNDEEADEDYEERLNGIWKVLVKKYGNAGYTVLDEIDADDEGIEIGGIETDDSALGDLMEELEVEWRKKKAARVEKEKQKAIVAVPVVVPVVDEKEATIARLTAELTELKDKMKALLG